MNNAIRIARHVLVGLAVGTAAAFFVHSAGLSPFLWFLRTAQWGFCLGLLLAYAALLLATYEAYRHHVKTRRQRVGDGQPTPLIALFILFSFILTKIVLAGGVQPSLQASWTIVLVALLTLTSILAANLRTHRSSTDTPPSKHDLRTLEDDQPIEDDQEDVLGRKAFIDRFAGQVLADRPEQPLVIAITGSWGEGKSSVLNLLANRIRAKKEPVLFFNPWYFSTPQSLLNQFYVDLPRCIRQSDSGYLRELFRQYRLVLTVGIPGTRVSIASSPETSPDSIKARIVEEMRRMESRLFVMIDDLDRVPFEHLRAVLQLVGLAAKIPKITFILAFDSRVVRARLKAEQEDPTFLEKIIQHSVTLPAVEQARLDQLLFPTQSGSRSRLDHILEHAGIEERDREEFAEKFYPVYIEHISRLLSTLRRVKRLLNGLRTTLPSVAGNVNLHDYVLLETLRLFYPDIHTDIIENPWYYCSEQGGTVLLASPLSLLNATERQERIRAHVDELLKPYAEAESLRGILGKLSIRVRAAYRGGSLLGATEQLTDDDLRAQRFSHPQIFPRYFLQGLPSGELSDRYVRDVIAQWNEGVDVEDVQAEIESHRDSGLTSELFQKLQVFRQDLGQQALEVVARGVSMLSRSFGREGGLWSSEYHRASFLVRWLLNELAPVRTQVVLRSLVEKSDDPQFIIDLVHAVDERREGSTWNLYRATALDEVKSIARGRIRVLFADAKRDVFDSDAEPVYVLCQWSVALDDHAGMMNYLRQLAASHPGYLGRFLRPFFVDSNDGPGVSRLGDFAKVVDLESFAALCANLDAANQGTVEERRAVAAFNAAVTSQDL